MSKEGYSERTDLVRASGNNVKARASADAQVSGNELSALRGGVLNTKIEAGNNTKNHKGDVTVNAQTICSVM